MNRNCFAGNHANIQTVNGERYCADCDGHWTISYPLPAPTVTIDAALFKRLTDNAHEMHCTLGELNQGHDIDITEAWNEYDAVAGELHNIGLLN